ncbi:MAG: alanine--tRNA ligase, partial [Anaerolineae bacterium]|nr:alanine--tRNA ligase [Anaerolineae bacterium]
GVREIMAPLFQGADKEQEDAPAPAIDHAINAQIEQIDAALASSGAETALDRMATLSGTDVKLSDFIEALPADSDTRDEVLMAGALPGDQVFRLHSEKGLPLEITRDICKERGFTVDEIGFRAAQRAHETISRGQDGGAFSAIDMGEAYLAALKTLRNDGLIDDGVQQAQYGPLSSDARVLAILHNGELVDSAQVGDKVEVVLDTTPFYVEAGGQVSDTGVIEGDGWTIDIEDAQQPIGGLIVHLGEVVEGQPVPGAGCTIAIDPHRRLDIQRNHTATHLLHAQLRAVLGTHVQQRGSLVAPDRLRFDFSHDNAVNPDELDQIAQRINAAILANMPVTAEETTLDEARAQGAMALFGEKYGEDVRTINIWQSNNDRYSYELCGGNHVNSTGVIGTFVFTSEGSVAQGIRRIEALTGRAAETYIRRRIQQVQRTAAQLGTTPDALGDRVTALQDDLKAQQQENNTLRRRVARLEFEDLLRQTEEVGGVSVLVAQVSPTASDTLREMTDWFRDKVDSGVVVLGMVAESGKPQLIAAATPDLKKRVHAGNIIRAAAKIVGGGGGGRPDMAQAGGKDPDKLDDALQHAANLIHEALA